MPQGPNRNMRQVLPDTDLLSEPAHMGGGEEAVFKYIWNYPGGNL